MTVNAKNNEVTERLRDLIVEQTSCTEQAGMSAALSVMEEFGLTEVYACAFDEEISDPGPRYPDGRRKQRFWHVQPRRLKAELDKERLQNSDSRSYVNFRTVTRVQGEWRTLAGTMSECPSCAGSGIFLPENIGFEQCDLCSGTGYVIR